MARLGNFVCSVYREESPSLDQYVKAMCEARKGFRVVPLDEVGITKTGEQYRYYSLNTLRECTIDALTACGILPYTSFSSNDLGAHLTVVLRHGESDQYVSSTALIPAGHDMQDDKAWKTTLEKELLAGLLQPLTERVTGEEREVPAEADAATDKKRAWATRVANAKAKLHVSTTRDQAVGILEKAAAYVSRGEMPPDCMGELKKVFEQKYPITPEEKTANANATPDAGDQGPDDDRRRGRRAANAAVGG